MDDTYLLETSTPDDESGKPSILIIEDNRDLSLFLKNKLMRDFEIHLSDGTDAIQKAFEFIPDIIICDINLPEKNGFEICASLKNDLRTSHIPTVILTASGNTESYLKGLESGADLYLTKPFSYSILIQAIQALLYNREKLRYYYTNNIHKITSTSTFGNLEQEFMQTLNVRIKDNLDKADSSVENLAEELHISRVQLYPKVKAMMGVSISDYIANIRLENARAMLESTTLTVSEIAYANGFSSPNYFSTAFKNQYAASFRCRGFRQREIDFTGGLYVQNPGY
ncbi:response regulator [Pricia sp.]|uniref:response regulator transcription factor n=1 Tax=Pricia sp. TaxID=2268138 RepID=UPI0035934B3A